VKCNANDTAIVKRRKMGAVTARMGGRVSARSGGGQGSGVIDVVNKEELQLSDFNKTDDDEDLFTTNVLLKKGLYMDNWQGKFVGAEHHANTAHEDGEELVSLDGSGDDGASQRKMRYSEFSESHDMRIPIELEKSLLFVDTSVFKKALKWYTMQQGFDFKYEHNDRVRVSVACKEQGCDWRIHASSDEKKESIQIKT
jgi:hypothetical protein